MSAITLAFGESYDPTMMDPFTAQDLELFLEDFPSVPFDKQFVLNKKEFYRYEGLDLTFVRRHWFQLKSDHQWTAEQLVRAVREACIIGAVFGNVTDNNFYKRSEDAQRFINEFLLKCKLVQHIDPKNKRTGVTISRTMAAFPIEAVRIAELISKDYPEGPVRNHCNPLPSYMKCIAFPAILPIFKNDKINTFCCQVFNIWSANMNLVINRSGPTKRKRSWSEKEFIDSYVTQWEYTTIAFGSEAEVNPRAWDMLIGWKFDQQYKALWEVYDAFRVILRLPQDEPSAADWAAAWGAKDLA